MGEKKIRRRPRVAGDPASMRCYGMLCALGPPDLQHHHRLPLRGGMIECSSKAIRVSDGFDKPADHFGVRIIDKVIEIIRRCRYRFIAGRDDMAEPEASDVVQQANAESAALRDDADIAGEPRRVA